MDPVGPWSAYASYNRLAGVQAGASGADLHHHLTSTGTPVTTTAQILSSGFLSPPHVGYDTVFSPLFHPGSAKPSAHYVTQVQQHRQALAQAANAKQTNEGDYHQAQAFFEQNASAWPQNSPFGILPHESVVPSTTSGKSTTASYENFNAHFVAAQGINHLNSPLAVVNSKNSSRAQSPHISNTVSAKSPATQPNSANFFQSSASTYASGNSSDASNNNKPFASSNSSNLQQSCIVSSSPNSSAASKDYHRVPQSRTIYLGSPNSSRPTDKQSFTAPQTKQLPQIQTKAQTKIYPELSNHVERQRQVQQNEDNSSQSSPISFSLMDAAGRISYAGSNSSAKRSQFQHSAGYRHYQSGNNSDTDFQRSKGGSEYSNGPDCNVVVPRRPSPLQAHSQASPLGHVPSPAYPMYNSPLNSISSPQNSNIVTPPSPLDVTVARTNAPQTTGNVAYPSVITRALNSNHNTNQSCWDEQRQQQQRKFIGQSNNANNYNSNSEVAARQVTNERQQQAYFESGQHQVSLQDLSSCRGDPMSIVKNLQQQSCQVQQSEIKQEIKSTAKRRKSNENKINNASVNDVVAGPNIAEYFSGRIPPPAHAATTNQPQQNGAYFDFENRWAPPSSSKIFGTQAAIHQQHQGLMVPHPHSHHPPPLPYFPPFHLAPHPNEFASAELAPIASYSEQPSQAASSSQFTQQESSPKVIVPNIEEELNFLSGGNHAPSTAVVPASTAVRRTSTTNQIIQPSKSSDKGPNTGSSDGFMNSYLKFLNGERNNSPPPPARGNRKQTWSRAKPMQQQPPQQPPQPGPNLATKPDGLSSISSVPLTPPPSLQVVTTPPVRPTIGDPQDDPRYFPLPKERKQNIFDSSDDGFTSDEDLFARKVTPVAKVEPPPKEKNKKKGRPTKGLGSAERKRSRDIPSYVKTQEENGNRDSPKLPPRRESSKRAAKEKTSMQQLMKQTVDDDLDEPIEFMDSDSDPAWTPQAREDLEEEITMKKSKKLGIRGRKRRNVTLYGSEFDEYSNDSQSGKKTKLPSGNKQVQKQNNAPTLEDNIAAAVAQQNNGPHNLSEDNLFKDGEFVALKSELGQEWPAIWRVDNVNLLQKFESFEQNGQTLYRNGSSFKAWAPENKKYYVNVPIKFIMQGQSEVIVELLRNEMIFIDHEFVKQAMKESEGYQDNFEVYIQTLISQALDSNFLTEIFQEQDEYFLTNVKTIDDITDTKKYKMINLLRWPNPVEIAVTTWPCLNVIRELGAADTQFHPCAACMKPGVAVRVLMYGQPYNSTTLEGCQPSTQFIEKDFLMCRICASHVELFNKITHQKYLMYIECAKRVAEKRTTDPNKDTTCILNELLADEQWLNQLFYDVRGSWAEVDNFEYSFKFKSVIQ